jgi:spore coat polysaccharide biosynthesis predicted glycosyltransferase SpsG
VGAGHAARQLSLAEALLAHGAEVTCELTEGELEGELAARFAGLGLRMMTPVPGAIVVVDLPDLATAEQRAPADRLVVFDDRDAFAGRAAIVVQPSLERWSGPGVADRILAGYRYAPVAGRYRELRDQAPPRAGRSARSEPETVLVCFGGSDPVGVTERVATALTGGSGWRATAIVGRAHRSHVAMPIEVVRDPSDLAERIAACDLALIGAGTMKFEVACVGRPAALLAVADDQLAVGPPFAATGAAVWVGDGRTIDPETVRWVVEELIEDVPRLRAMADRGLELVDGWGADRIARAVLELATDRS